MGDSRRPAPQVEPRPRALGLEAAAASRCSASRLERIAAENEAAPAPLMGRLTRAPGALAQRSRADLTPYAIREELSIAVGVHDDLVLISLAGPLDIYTVPGFRRKVDPHVLAGGQIVVDLAEAT